MPVTSPRIGILGGTFDPIHLGHLEAASAARRELSLDRILILPARTPPHRSIEPRASVFHRFAMAALAAAERDMIVSDLELRREGPSYTALTLEALHRDGYSPLNLYFITGQRCVRRSECVVRLPSHPAAGQLRGRLAARRASRFRTNP
jgi:nicotinate-nucleotide adenylyltransferase